MQHFAITIHRGTPAGVMVADLTRYATSCSWSYNLHGCRDLTLKAPRRLLEAMRLYQMSGLLWAVVSQGGRRVWAGRLSTPELWAGDKGSGITLRALGRWADLGLVPYTGMWSTTDLGRWQPAVASLGGTLTNMISDRFEIDTNNRIYIAPKKGELFGSTAFNSDTAVGGMYMLRPDDSDRSIQYVSFTYAVLGAGWSADILRLNDDLSYAGSVVWSQSGTGSGTFAGAVTACGGLALRFYRSGADANLASESGTIYVRLTNMRVNGDNAATVTAPSVVSVLATYLNGINPSLVSTATITESPGLDLTDEIYEDADPRDILNALAERGDGAGTLYTAGVDVEGHVLFRPVGRGGRAWSIDVADITVASEREQLANSVYAIYEDAEGRTLRTAISVDAASVGRAGYTRRVAVGVNTTSASRAENYRDQTLLDGATAPASGRYTLRRVLTDRGAIADPADVRPGDTVTIRNLPLAAASGSEIDRVRNFRISESEYDPMADPSKRLTITPETPQPRLEVLIAQGAI
jgi:hypothetical protein